MRLWKSSSLRRGVTEKSASEHAADVHCIRTCILRFTRVTEAMRLCHRLCQRDVARKFIEAVPHTWESGIRLGTILQTRS